MKIRTARDLGVTIKQARKMRGLSQSALAKEVGIYQPKISALERGAPGVRIGLVLQIMRALDTAHHRCCLRGLTHSKASAWEE